MNFMKPENTCEDGVNLPSYKGETINAHAFDKKSRISFPNRIKRGLDSIRLDPSHHKGFCNQRLWRYAKN